MAANAKSTTEEEEEEEDEGPVIDVHHRKLVYKVHPIQSEHPTTSAHLVSQSASTHSSSSSYSKSSSYMVKMEGKTSQMSTSSQPLLPEIVQHPAPSPLDYTQENRVQSINVKAMEQFLPPEIGQEASLSSGNSFQQPDIYQESQYSDTPVTIGTSSDRKEIIAESSLDQDVAYTMPKDFGAYNPNSVLILNYDEMLSDVLQGGSLSGTQHAPLFGHATENLLNFPTSDFDLLGTNSNSANVADANESNLKNHVIMGITQDGQVIHGALSSPLSEESSTGERIVSSTLYTVHSSEETPSIPFSQIPEDSDEQYLGAEHGIGNKVVAGLTAQNEPIVAGLTASGPSDVTEHLISVVMGLTTDGQIICGGGMVDSTLEGMSRTSEKTSECGEHHVAIDIITNLTAENEKVLSGLSLASDSDLTAASATSYSDGATLLRRDSF